MSIFDDVGDFVSDAADAVVDVVEGAIELAGDALEAIASVAMDAIEGTADVLATVAEAGAAATLELSEAMLTAMDDVVFDTVDFVTAGLIDLDYDDGAFGASVGIDDVFGFSVHVSENGFAAEYDAWVVGAEVALNADGISASGSMGIDWGPLPYVEGHASVDENGNVGVGGEVQVYLPTPAGLSGVELMGDYQETDEGFQLTGSTTGGNYAYTGTYAKAGVHSSYEEDDDGYKFQVGVHGELGQVGVGSVKASVDYVEGRQGSTSYEGVTAGVSADGFGASIEAEGSYTHLETPEGEIDIVTGKVTASGGGNTVTASGGAVSGPAGTQTFGEVTHEVDELGLAMSAAEVAGDTLGVGGPSDFGMPAGGMKDLLGEAAPDVLGETATSLLSETATDLPGRATPGAVGDTATHVFGETAADFLGEPAEDVLGAAPDAVGTAGSDMLTSATDDVLGDVAEMYVESTHVYVETTEVVEGAGDVVGAYASSYIHEEVYVETADAMVTVEAVDLEVVEASGDGSGGYASTYIHEEVYVETADEIVTVEAVELEVVELTYEAPAEEAVDDAYSETADEFA